MALVITPAQATMMRKMHATFVRGGIIRQGVAGLRNTAASIFAPSAEGSRYPVESRLVNKKHEIAIKGQYSFCEVALLYITTPRLAYLLAAGGHKIQCATDLSLIHI